jgi:hypothetical protein
MIARLSATVASPSSAVKETINDNVGFVHVGADDAP